MKGILGRRRQISAFVVTGNKNGSAGIALGKAVDTKAALRKAKNRAGQKLLYIDIFNNHGGFGLVCHRAIKTTCEVIGIKDIYAKIEGPTNLQHIIKAFLIGLLQQKTHQMLAEEKKLHVVEFRKENDYFPNVIASPSTCRTPDEIEPNEVMDYTQYALGDGCFSRRRKPPPFFTKLPSWENYLKKTQYTRNRENVKVTLLAEYGEIQSFYREKYPECVHGYRDPKETEAE